MGPLKELYEPNIGSRRAPTNASYYKQHGQGQSKYTNLTYNLRLPTGYINRRSLFLMETKPNQQNKTNGLIHQWSTARSLCTRPNFRTADGYEF